MKIVRWALIGLSVVVAGFLSYCSYTEKPESYFSNYEEAKLSGIMEHGWIPTFIPRSSTEINERHDLDSNQVKMTFRYAPGDTEDVKKNCTKENTTRNSIYYKCNYQQTVYLIELRTDGTGKLESATR